MGLKADRRRPTITIRILPTTGHSIMRKFSTLCVVVSIVLSTTAAFGRGGMGSSSHMSMTVGSFGSSGAAPGTSSLGTALPSSGVEKPMKGPLLGTDPAIDREEARVNKMIDSICRGSWRQRPQHDLTDTGLLE